MQRNIIRLEIKRKPVNRIWRECSQKCEEILENSKEYARTYTAIPKQKRIQDEIDQVIRYRASFNGRPIDDVDIKSIETNTSKRYDDLLKMLSCSIEQWYDLRNSITCDITGKKIPYDTNYLILSIPDKESYTYHDLVLSVDGLNQLCDSASELLQ